MPRQARVQSPTGYYHIMMRGNNREYIFATDDQKRLFVDSLYKQVTDQLIDIAAYCIMDNHVHIAVKADSQNLIKAIKSTNTKYAMSFNGKRNRIGHVFQDRYKSETINDDKYLMQVIRYIHNNPVKAKMVKYLSDYNWSSYNEYIRANSIVSRKQKEFVLEYFFNSLEQFSEFHKQKDSREYLDIKEDIVKERLELGQEIISSYFTEKGLVEAKQVRKNPMHLEEIIVRLLRESKLTHRQIACLLFVSNSTVHEISRTRI